MLASQRSRPRASQPERRRRNCCCECHWPCMMQLAGSNHKQDRKPQAGQAHVICKRVICICLANRPHAVATAGQVQQGGWSAYRRAVDEHK